MVQKTLAEAIALLPSLLCVYNFFAKLFTMYNL